MVAAGQGLTIAPESETEYADLEAAIRGEIARWAVPGIAVGVLKEGETTLLAAGTANLNSGQAVAPGTLFQIGSITKIFLTTAVMRLVDEGKVSLDAPLATYLPDLRLVDADLPNRLTLRHLVTHTSGLFGDHFVDFGWGDDATARYLASLAELRQVHAPDETWSYCNSGFVIAGRIIEVVTGKPFETALRELVLDPLGLQHSFLFANEAIVHAVAAGHLHGDDGRNTVATPWPIARCSNAAGGIVASTADLLRFAAFHMGDGTAGGERVLSADSLKAMQTPQVRLNDAIEWGLGWRLSSVDGVRTVAHDGGTNGFNAQFTVVPERNWAIAALTNSSRGSAAYRSIVRWAMAHDLGLEQPEPARVALPPEAMARVEGVYEAALATSTFSVKDGRLGLDLALLNPFTGEKTKRPRVALDAIGQDAFVVAEGEAAGGRIDFIFGADSGPDAPPRYARVFSRIASRLAE